MKRSVVLVSFILATSLPLASYSANVFVIVEGVFSEYSDPDGLLPFAEPAPGTIFTIELTYDDTTPDDLFFLPDIGIYGGAISDASLTISSDVFGIGEFNSILILDDSDKSTSGDPIDVWAASTNTTTPTGTPNMETSEGFSFSIWNQLLSTPVPPLTSDSLVIPSWPSGWDTGEMRYFINLQSEDGTGSSEGLAWATATVTSLTATVVPLPATVWLFVSALALLGWTTRRTA